MKAEPRSHFASIPKRSFRNSVTHLLEHNYKLVGSHKVIQMMADDIVELHKEYYPDTSQVGCGSNWSAIGQGLDGQSSYSSVVHAIAIHGSDIYVDGIFTIGY